MKAYKNSKGCIMAVFKNDHGLYGVYSRADETAYFKIFDQRYPCRATRAEAENDMSEMAYRSKDRTWKPIEFRG